MKFSAKIFLLFSIFVLAIFIPLGTFLYYVGTQTTVEQIKQNLQQQVNYSLDKMDWALFECAADMEVISTTVIEDYLDSPEELTEHLTIISNIHQIYNSLAFYDQNQKRIANTTGQHLGEFAPDSIWTQEVYQQGIDSIAHEIYFSQETQTMHVIFAVPVWEDKILKGALVAEISIDKLFTQLVNDKNIHVDLINREGLLLYSNHNSSKLLQPVISKNATNSAFLMHDHEQSIYTSATERGYLNFPGNGWSLIIHYPKKEVLKPLINLRSNIILYGSILLLVVMLAVLFFAHKIIQPIISLQKAAQQLGAGNFDIQIAAQTKDEFGDLARAFNQASLLLKTQFLELEQFRTIVDISIDNIFILNANTMRFVYVNNNTITSMGYSQEEMMQMTPMDIDAAQSADQVGQILGPLRSGEISVFRFESIHRRKNERTFPVEISLQYIELNEQNQFFIAVVRDISERKQSEKLLQDYNQQLKEEIEAQTAELVAQTEVLVEKNLLLQQESEKRQQIAVTLRQKEEFLRLVIDNVPQLIFWKDVNSVYLGCNQHTATTNQLAHPSEIIGKTDHELVWAHYADKYVQDDQRIMASNQAELRMIECYQTEKGEVIWLETNKIPLHNAEGQVVGILGNADDITSRRKAELFLKEYNQRLEEEIAAQTEELEAQNEELVAQTETLEEKTHLLQQEITQRQQVVAALHESEERFALAMQGANDGLWDWDLETGEIYYSKRWKEMLGFAENELPNKIEVFFEHVHPEDKAAIEKTVSAYTSKQSPSYEVTIRLRHKDNQYRWILTRAVGVWNAEGKAVRLVGTHVDLTAQKQVEEALMASERKFRELHERLRDGLVSVDLQGKIIEFNQSFKEILSCYTEEEIYQLSYQDITPEKWHAIEAKLLQEQVMVRGYSDLYEKEYLLRDGSVVPIEIQAYLVADTQNNPKYLWGIVRNIFERKQVEKALQQAKETAEVANQAKSSFLANMSHELRTPLNGILGYAQILNRDPKLTEKQREGVDIIQRSGDYLLTLINDILDLAKIEAGRIELYETDIHFDEFVQSIVQLFKIRAEQKGIAFFYERLMRLPAGIRADEKRLRQILINLLGNAIKFTEVGGVSLKISCDDTLLHFYIEDTGVGIAQEELEDIFHPFKQVGDQNQRAEGTGLGLSITQKLIEKMKGTLNVSSTLGKGSCFKITIPLIEVSNLIIKTTKFEPIIIGCEGKVRHILVIDDKMENRLVLINLLKPLGFAISEAHNGQQGLEKLNEIQPDIVLTDLVMPVMDGFEFARHFRKMPQFHKTPVVAVSASVFDYHQKESMEAGCDAFLPKPINADALLNTLQEYLGLEWIYDSFESTLQQNTRQMNDESFEITTDYQLSPEYALQLHRLGLEGDVAAILEIVEELRTQAELSPLINRIEQLTKNFDTDSVSELMQSYL